jgi:hypothetical protein
VTPLFTWAAVHLRSIYVGDGRRVAAKDALERLARLAADERFGDRFDRIARWVVFTVLLLLAFAATACAQMTPAHSEGRRKINTEVSYTDLAGFLGLTFCTDKGVYTMVRPDMPPDQYAATVAHEAKHVEQFHRFPSCDAWQQNYATPKGKLLAEAEAYGTDLCVLVGRGYDKLNVLQDYAGRLERIMGGEVNRLEVLQTINGFAKC